MRECLGVEALTSATRAIDAPAPAAAASDMDLWGELVEQFAEPRVVDRSISLEQPHQRRPGLHCHMEAARGSSPRHSCDCGR